jgi:DNA-binding transcriptional MerR regulator
VDPHKEAALNKAPDAFRTISEVADELDLPQHVLRFWESRFPHIKPMKRGGGRRYYRPEDIDLLRGIRHLLYGDGYTIRGVQRILREQGVRIVQSVGQGHPVVLPSRDKAAEPGNSHDGPEFLPPLFGTNRSELSLSAMTDGEGVGGGEHSEEAGPETVPQRRSVGEALQPALPLAATGSAAAGSAAVVSQPSGLAPEDLDRLRAALAALEACSRLLDESGGA